MMRAGVAVGSKPPMAPTMTVDERAQFVIAAVIAGVLDPQQCGADLSRGTDKLLREYRKWYVENERK